MPFITKSKTNIKYLLIVVILAAVVGLVLWINLQTGANYYCEQDEDCVFACPCGCINKDSKCKTFFGMKFTCEYAECECSNNQCIIKQTGNLEDKTADWQIYRNEDYGFEMEYSHDYSVDERIDGFIRGPNDLSLFINKFKGGLILPGGEIIIKEKESSLSDYVDYFYRKSRYENPASGAYKNPEYKDIMNTDYFENILSKNENIEIWRQSLTKNLEGFESVAYLMDRNKGDTIIRFSWGVISYDYDEILGQSLLKQFDEMLSTFKFLD